LPVAKIRSGIEGLLRNSKCADFVDKLLARVFKLTGDMAAGTPLEVFDDVMKQGGFIPDHIGIRTLMSIMLEVM
jgi:hypothetical protein